MFQIFVTIWSHKGGEYYTEYGSIVPNEINEIITEEANLERKKSGEESFVYGANTGDAEGLLFPDIKLEGDGTEKTAEEDSSSSWWFW